MFDRTGPRCTAVFASVLASSVVFVAADSLANDAAAVLERPYVTISGGVAWPDEARQVHDGIGLKLSLGWALNERWSAEFRATHFHFAADTTSATALSRTALGLDAVYAVNTSGWSPLLLVGVGAAHNDVTPDGRDSTDFTANVGFGLMTPALNDYGTRMRLETRYVYDAFEDAREDLHAYLGVSFPLRRPRTIEVVRPEVKEIVRENIVREEPPRDSDGDGVIDALDRCPNTLHGARVARDGCVVESAVIVLQGVHFEHGSAQLTDASMAILMQVANSLRGQSTVNVEIAGHTDSTGSDGGNLALSVRRAQSVVDFLVSQGIERSRLTAVGYGASRPIADNSTAAGRASNRRVEFRVLAR
jgi:OOP family OmpA-OmpF porin